MFSSQYRTSPKCISEYVSRNFLAVYLGIFSNVFLEKLFNYIELFRFKKIIFLLITEFWISYKTCSYSLIPI